MAAQHLLGREGRRFAFVGNPDEVTHSADRLEGFRDTIRKARPRSSVSVIVTRDLTIGDGTAAARHLLSLPKRSRPDAVFAANDLVAIGLVHALTQEGLKVPADVAVVGYDDIDLADQIATPLTTIRQPARHLGSGAAAMVIDRVEGACAELDEHVKLTPELVVRSSA